MVSEKATILYDVANSVLKHGVPQSQLDDTHIHTRSPCDQSILDCSLRAVVIRGITNSYIT